MASSWRGAMSPPAWGWPGIIHFTFNGIDDVPTRVGMARGFDSALWDWLGCPHPRGDGPTRSTMSMLATWMSPPAWGWPGKCVLILKTFLDVPTRVGMARGVRPICDAHPGCPHPRGDGPKS